MTNRKATLGAASIQSLTDWLEAVALFRQNYSILTSFLTQSTEEPNNLTSYEFSVYRTPDNPLTLLITMQAELEKLVAQLDQLSTLKTSSKQFDWAFLTTHTLTLNRLNQRAQTHLQQLIKDQR